MKQIIKPGLLCSCMMASFFLVGLLASEEVQATHFQDPVPNLTDVCPHAGDFPDDLILWTPPAGTTEQRITVKKRSTVLCFDHNLSGTANSFFCDYDGASTNDRITIFLEWDAGMWQNEHWFCKAP